MDLKQYEEVRFQLAEIRWGELVAASSVTDPKKRWEFIYRPRVLIASHDQTSFKRQRLIGHRLDQHAIVTTQ